MSAASPLPSAFSHLFAPPIAARSADEQHMAAALLEAHRGTGRTAPNPPVGAVVVKDGVVLGAGFHARAGERHGEIVALDEARARRGADAARGATLYVTLEPCVHLGRTPPCVDRILADGVARVVVGAVDPNPRVHEKGIARLRAAGVVVDLVDGELGRRCEALVAPFLRSVVDGRVYTVLKIAASLDGRIATASGASRFITNETSRALVHRLRDACDAVVVGAGTMLADDPALTVRGVPGGRDPLRVVVDGQGRVPAAARALDGAAVFRAAPGAAHVDLAAMLASLARERQLSSALVEAGPGLATALLAAHLVDELWWMQAPMFLGADAKSAIGPLALATPDHAGRFAVVDRRDLDGDTLIVLRPPQKPAESL